MVKGRVITGVIGGVVGLLSLMTPSFNVSGSLFGQEVVNVSFTLFQLLNASKDPTFILIIIALIGLGSIIAFVHPIGGVLQLTGGLLLGAGVTSQGGTAYFGIAGITIQLQLGFYLIMLASIITLIGFAFRKEKEKHEEIKRES